MGGNYELVITKQSIKKSAVDLGRFFNMFIYLKFNITSLGFNRKEAKLYALALFDISTIKVERIPTDKIRSQ